MDRIDMSRDLARFRKGKTSGDLASTLVSLVLFISAGEQFMEHLLPDMYWEFISQP
jgi:hypothetical protein